MNDETELKIEASLRDLTRWNGPAPQLWRRALVDSATDATQRGRVRFRGLPVWLAGLTLGTAAVVVLTVLVSSMSGVRTARSPGWNEYSASRRTPASESAEASSVLSEASSPGPSRLSGFLAGSEPSDVLVSKGVNFSVAMPQDDLARPSPAASADRQVVRKATLELVATDVQATFRRVQLHLSEAQGEYVQDSNVSGSGAAASATLTLRVAVARFPAMLNELRALGEVRSERITGEDVTAQAVDLAARLRNEQRIETELLELLEKRKDAPLKDVLELRESLSRVRQAIEQLQAQRDQLSRLVSLATVLVLIYPADAPPPAAEPGLGAFFQESLAKAWAGGLRVLASSIGVFVWLFVGGAMWWLLLLLIVVWLLAVRRTWRVRGATARGE